MRKRSWFKIGQTAIATLALAVVFLATGCGGDSTAVEGEPLPPAEDPTLVDPAAVDENGNPLPDSEATSSDPALPN